LNLALCYTCFMAKWRNNSKFLGDIPPDAQGELCVQCRGAVAIIRVEAAILGIQKPQVQKKLDMIYDFTTYAHRELYKFATCIFFTRSENDRVEVYLDEIAAAAFEAKRRLIHVFGLNAEKFSDPVGLIVPMIADAVVHEWLHHEIDLDERPARFASEQLYAALLDKTWPRLPSAVANMVWSHMVCPLKKGKQHPEAHVTFDECLLCMDNEKAPDCPVWELRWQLLGRRPSRLGTYHVTEAVHPRRAYYDRIHDYSQMWDEVWDYFFGHAVHSHIQETYPRPYREIYVTQDFTRGNEKITLLGGIDAYDPAQRVVLEFKTYATLDFAARDEPESDHVYQAQAYVAMAKTSKPWLVVDKIRLVYLAKTRSHRGIARYREFLIEPKAPEDLEARAWALHDALQGGQPAPAQRCTPWVCRFCPHIGMCAEDYQARGILEHAEDLQRIIGRPRGPDFGENVLAGRETKAEHYRKSDQQFKRYLEQHKRGVEMILKWLQSLGHEVTAKEDALSTEIRKDPGTKGDWSGDYDLYDKTDDLKIDVKTTNVDQIWQTRSRLEACQGEPLLFYIVFLKSKPVEVRKVWADTLWRNKRHAGRKFNRSREPVYVFRKDLAEKVEADWSAFLTDDTKEEDQK